MPLPWRGTARSTPARTLSTPPALTRLETALSALYRMTRATSARSSALRVTGADRAPRPLIDRLERKYPGTNPAAVVPADGDLTAEFRLSLFGPSPWRIGPARGDDRRVLLQHLLSRNDRDWFNGGANLNSMPSRPFRARSHSHSTDA